MCTTIPTGANVSPNAAQASSEFIARMVQIKFPSVATNVYIDNVRLLCNHLPTLQDAMTYLFEVCKDMRIEINEKLDDVLITDPQHYEFLGVVYDHVKATTCLNARTKEKLTHIASTIASPEVPLRQVMRCSSLLQYAATINGTNKGCMYHLYKFMRRRASEGAFLDAAAHIWPCIQSHWAIWAKAEQTAPVRVWRRRTSGATMTRGHLYTDASNDGWGAILFHEDGRMSIRGAKWTQAELEKAGYNSQGNPNINVLEAMAVRAALDTMDLREMSITLFVDNTSVSYRLPKGTSKSFRLNTILTQLHDHRFFSNITHILYVPSASNMADMISRLYSRPVTTASA